MPNADPPRGFRSLTDGFRSMVRGRPARMTPDLAAELQAIRLEIESLRHTDRPILNKLIARNKDQANQLRDLRRVLEGVQVGIQSLIRRAFMDPASLDHPQSLLVQRFGLRSQNEEDGLTWALFQLVGVANRRFVEVGCGTNGGNAGFLAGECGWTGLMIDASEERIKRIRSQFGSNVTALARWTTRENVNETLQEHGLVGDVDLLGVDIDGNDYWVWEALTACLPRVVVIEFNPFFGPRRAVVVPYAPDFDRHAYSDNRYYGASLAAMVRLGSHKGYRLVCVEPRGVNAYFLRNDVHPALGACSAAQLFRSPDTAAGPGEDVFAAIDKHQLALVDLGA